MEIRRFLPWVPEVFLVCGGTFVRRDLSAEGRHSFGCRPKPRAVKPREKLFAFRAGHYKDLTETGNRARKVSGTQGRRFPEKEANLCQISNKILNLRGWKKFVLQILRLQWVKDSSDNLFQNCLTCHFCVFFQKLLHLKALTMKPMLFTCWKMEVSRCVLHCSN